MITITVMLILFVLSLPSLLFMGFCLFVLGVYAFGRGSWRKRT